VRFGWTYAPVLAYQIATMEVLPDALLSAELGQGERLLWSGKPRGGMRLRAQDAFLIRFSLMWCGFAIFWEVGVSMHSDPLFGPGLFLRLWGLPFVIKWSDQSGTITFGFGQPIPQTFSRGSRYSPPAFEMIENVKNVYQLIVGTHKKLLGG
jgi:hypothetical protein